MASHAIYLKVSGKYYPCEPKKAWLRKHLPVMLWVWQFERKLTGARWIMFVSWNMSYPVTIYRVKAEQISKDELEGEPIVFDPIPARNNELSVRDLMPGRSEEEYQELEESLKNVMDAFTYPTEGVEDGE